jgi:hypothetical protein
MALCTLVPTPYHSAFQARNGICEGNIVKMFPQLFVLPDPVFSKCEGNQRNAPWLGLTIIKDMTRKGLDDVDGGILSPREGNRCRR